MRNKIVAKDEGKRLKERCEWVFGNEGLEHEIE